MRRLKHAPADRLDRLWSPWRMTYIQEAVSPSRRGAKERPAAAARAAAPDGCLFCRVREGRDDRGDLVLARRPAALLMLNRYPYNPAHLMVAVTRHAARFADLEGDEARDLLDLVALAEVTLASEYHPDGVNYGINVGRVAGAGFPGHLHLHLVPRWNGDTNFMPTLAGTKVLPESLGRTWTRLRKALAALDRGQSGSAGGTAPGRRRRSADRARVTRR